MIHATPQQIAAAKSIENLRLRLLDLKNSNKLISFKHSEKARTHVRAIDELPDALFERLSGSGKGVTFRSLPDLPDEPADERTEAFELALEEARVSNAEYLMAVERLGEEDTHSKEARRIERLLRDTVRGSLGMAPWKPPRLLSIAEYAISLGLSPSYDLPASDISSKARHKDHIQLMLLPDQMERKLSGLTDLAKTSLRETGINTLYVAFGFLEWYENASSAKAHLAPLLLLPVQIERNLVKGIYTYVLTGTGEEPVINLTLSERLTRDFGMRMPERDEDESPESYFCKIVELINDRPLWRVRRLITVGHFAYARLIMFQDLDLASWPGGRIPSAHPVVSEMLGGRESEAPIHAEEYDVDAPEISANIPLLIADADSSQISAIVDVMQGKNLVVKGPPGTGKSQTITNIIAAAMAMGKKVLFVAEKLAALEVVKNRLDHAELGSFCFELHSTKARKKEVLESLEASLSQHGQIPSPPELHDAEREMEDIKGRLNTYARLINKPFGALGFTIQEVLWAEQCTRTSADRFPEGLERRPLAQIGTGDEDEQTVSHPVLAITRFDAEKARTLLADVEEMHAAFMAAHGAPSNHPWHGVGRGDLALYDQEEVVEAAERLRRALVTLRSVLDEAASTFGVKGDGGAVAEVSNQCCGMSPEAAEALLDALGCLPEPIPMMDGAVLAALAMDEARTAIAALLVALENHRRAQEEAGHVSCDVDGALDRVELAASIGQMAEASGLSDIPFAELPALEKQDRVLAGRVGELISYAQALITAFGADPSVSMTPLALRPLILAAQATRSADRRTLLLRTPLLVEEKNAEVLRVAIHEHRELASIYAEADRHFVLSACTEVVGVRGHAAALKGAGSFWFLSHSVRAARRFHASVSRAASARKTHAEMAQDLQAVAEIVEKVQAFAQRERYRSLIGDRFSGLDTDFAVVESIIHFAEEVRHLFPGEAKRLVRDALLNSPIERLDTIIQLAADERFAALAALLTQADVEARTSLVDLAARLATRADAARDIVHAAHECGVRSSQTPSGVQTRLVPVLKALANIKREIGESAIARNALGNLWAGTSTDVTRVNLHFRLVVDLRAATIGRWGHIAMWLLHPDHVARRARIDEITGQLDTALAAFARTAGEFDRRAGLDESAFFGCPLSEAPVDCSINRLDCAIQARTELGAWVGYVRHVLEARTMGLRSILDAYDEESRPYCSLPAAYDRILYRTLARAAFDLHPELRKVSGLTQESLRRRYRELDQRVMTLKRQDLAAQLCRAPVDPGIGIGAKREWTGRALILNEVGKQKKHISIRELLARAGRAVQALKPCFMQFLSRN